MPRYEFECPKCKARVASTVPLELRDQTMLGCPNGDGGAMRYAPDLEGIALDRRVAELAGYFASGLVVELNGKLYDTSEDGPDDSWSPSTKWSQGGPIIERELINLQHWMKYHEAWSAWWQDIEREGQTPLVAAMRVYVAAKAGR